MPETCLSLLEPEKQEIRTQLDAGRKALSEALAGVDDHMAVWKHIDVLQQRHRAPVWLETDR
jgi:hypothetical protein